MKIRFFPALLLVLLSACIASRVASAGELSTIKMKVVAANPSKSKAQSVVVKAVFPKEITMKDIRETSGLNVEYSDDQGVYYVQKEVILEPSETKVFEIVMNDVWNIAEEELQRQKQRMDKVMVQLKNTQYMDQAELLAKTIYGRLEEIETTQNDANATKQQHIAYYRDNLKAMQAVKEDIEKLEKLLVSLGGAPSAELLEKAGSSVKSPSMKTTWGVIFALIIFVGILSSVFYFTWLRQGRLTENIFTKEKDTAFGDLKNQAKTDEKGP